MEVRAARISLVSAICHAPPIPNPQPNTQKIATLDTWKQLKMTRSLF